MVQEILSALEIPKKGHFPIAAVQEIMAKRAEFTPHFLEIVQKVTREHQTLDQKYCAHFFALYFLGLWREPRAFPLFADLLSLDEDSVDSLIGERLTEDAHEILASTYDGDFKKLTNLIDSPATYLWSRNAFLSAMGSLHIHGRISRPELIAYFQNVLRERKFDDENVLYTNLSRIACDIGAIELKSELREAFEHGLVDEAEYDEDDLGQPLPIDLEPLQDDRDYRLIDDDSFEAMMEWPVYAALTEVPKSRHDKEKKKKLRKAAKKQRKKNR